MSQAKTNRTLPKDVRRKMSASHKGKKHSPETASLLSTKLRGRAKSPAHRLAIAAAQRKRHAAARVLQAVENVHRQSQAEGTELFLFLLCLPVVVVVVVCQHAFHIHDDTSPTHFQHIQLHRVSGHPQAAHQPSCVGPYKARPSQGPPTPPGGLQGPDARGLQAAAARVQGPAGGAGSLGACL